MEGLCKAGCGRAYGGTLGSLNLGVKYIVGTGMTDWRTRTYWNQSSAICSGRYQNIINCIVLVSLNIKSFLSFLIHIFPVAQTGKMEGRIPTVLEVGTGDASCALISCTFPQEPFPCHELGCSSSSSNSLNTAAGCCCCCCSFITTNGTSCSLLWYGWAMQNNTSTLTKHDETNYCLSPSGVRALHWAAHRNRVSISDFQ